MRNTRTRTMEIPIVERTFDDMVAEFNRCLGNMNIPHRYKIELAGRVCAMAYKYQKDTERLQGEGKR